MGSTTAPCRVGRVRAHRRGQVWYLSYFEQGRRRQPRRQLFGEIVVRGPASMLGGDEGLHTIFLACMFVARFQFGDRKECSGQRAAKRKSFQIEPGPLEFGDRDVMAEGRF